MKTVLLLFALVVGSGNVWAADPEFEFNLNELYQNGTKVTTKTVISESNGTLTFTDKDENFTILLTRNSGNQPGFYTGSGYFRFYSSDTFKLTAASGITIKKVVISPNGSSFSLSDLDGLDKSKKTWTGSASEVTFTGAGTNKWDKITITYTSSGSNPSISADNVGIAYNATAGSISYTINNAVTGGALTAAKTSDSDWLTVGAVSASAVAFTTSVNTGAARTATVRLTYTYDTDKIVTKDVAITQSKAIGTYALATSITSGKHYIIVGKNGSDYVAMGYDKGSNRDAVDVEISSGTITGAEAVYDFIIYGPDACGRYTIYDETKDKEGYLYAAGSGNNYLKTHEVNNIDGKWSIDIDSKTGVASVVADGSSNRNVMQYNSGSSLFSCYSSDSQSDVYLYERNDDTPVATTTSVNLNGSGYATFATTTALDFIDAEKASFSAWQITGVSGSTITFEQITSHLRAGAGILLKGTANATINLNILPFSGGALSGNKLVGITTATTVDADTYYGLSGNQFKKVNAGTVPAGKALLPASEVAGARELTFVFEDATGIKHIEKVNADINGFYNLNGQKVLNPTNGLIALIGVITVFVSEQPVATNQENNILLLT